MTVSTLGRVVRSRTFALIVTAGILYVLLRRFPIDRLFTAIEQADYRLFFAVMIPNTIFYYCWDTLVLTVVVRWFHGPVRYRELLPVRAASYVVAFFNTNAGRGALAAYLSRRLGSPFLQLGSTVIFLVLTEYIHLVAWATIGILQIGSEVRGELLWVPPGIALVWFAVFVYARAGGRTDAAGAGASLTPIERSRFSRLLQAGPIRWLLVPRTWGLLRTFRLAPARRYAQVVLLRSPMFAVSLCLHAVAARAFGLEIPFLHLLAFLPIIFMVAALPITVARLGTTQAAWVFFFGGYADTPSLLAFSLAAHLTFVVTRSLLGIVFLPRAYSDLISPSRPDFRTPERVQAGSCR